MSKSNITSISKKYEHTILLVDDEQSVLKSLKRLFMQSDYLIRILTAESGKKALELLEQENKSVSLIISDQRMPVMTGARFLEKAKKYFPIPYVFF